MKIHEYQAKQLLAGYGVPVPVGRVCNNAEDAAGFAKEIGAPVVVKAQVHVGGRGKAGGIKVAKDPSEAESIANAMLGSELKGLTIEKVLVEKAINIDQEYYLGITIDRNMQKNVVMVSAAGGVDIEEVAATTPEKITKMHIDPSRGLMDFQIRKLIFDAGLPRSIVAQATKFLRALYTAYIDTDASLAEINPLVLTKEGEVIAADAKINIDDNALFRHPEFNEYKEESEEDPIEAEAHRRGIQYVRLDGHIGIIGNGAGLVMATLDEVKRAGGNAANFLDIGGGAQAELVRSALEVVLLDPKVKGVFFNVFGGITRCDEVAKGILEATSTMEIKVPIVARLTGTMAEAGQKLLEGSKLIPAATMQEAAEKIVALAK
ncbi:MAG: ADP-forming succinate--CoA ligase subunit beta [Armatimonadota bacterium]